ncbi:terminase small subunit [Deefgea piscis]|uniref:terminase small subunit n=2 Tax=Deefgea piscis TaxID=2739061 RepID=UPI001C8122EC|nr:terminase small subunit [Deefgea piscis]QZA80248.1 terminase small subunit [Deefgea piscis]
MGKIVNKNELAQIVGVSERTLTEWQRAGMPMVLSKGRGTSNQYDTAQVLSWRIAKALTGSSESAKDRLDRLRGDQIERQMEIEARQLVTVADIEPALSQFFSDAVALLTGLPDKYAQIFETAESLDAKHAALEDMIAEIRQALGDYEYCTHVAQEYGEGFNLHIIEEDR